MHRFGRARLLVLTLICVCWTGLILLGHFLPDVPFLSAPWRGEQSFEDLLRREGRKTAPPRDFIFLGLDQSTLHLPPMTAEEIAGSRALQLMTEQRFPWSREVWALLLDRLFAAGARLVMFDLIFDKPEDGDSAFHTALDRYRDKVVLGANIDMQNPDTRQVVTPNDALIPSPQMRDGRVGFVNFWADPIDEKIRAVNYRVTDRQIMNLPPHNSLGHLQPSARPRQQLVEHIRLGPKPRHWRRKNPIVPNRIQLSAWARHGLLSLGARGKIRPGIGSESCG